MGNEERIDLLTYSLDSLCTVEYGRDNVTVLNCGSIAADLALYEARAGSYTAGIRGEVTVLNPRVSNRLALYSNLDACIVLAGEVSTLNDCNTGKGAGRIDYKLYE